MNKRGTGGAQLGKPEALRTAETVICGGAVVPRSTCEGLRELIEQTRSDACAANECIQSLVEMLHGCPPGHQVSARYLAALLVLVQAYMANVADAFAVAVTAT